MLLIPDVQCHGQGDLHRSRRSGWPECSKAGNTYGLPWCNHADNSMIAVSRAYPWQAGHGPSRQTNQMKLNGERRRLRAFE